MQGGSIDKPKKQPSKWISHVQAYRTLDFVSIPDFTERAPTFWVSKKRDPDKYFIFTKSFIKIAYFKRMSDAQVSIPGYLTILFLFLVSFIFYSFRVFANPKNFPFHAVDSN